MARIDDFDDDGLNPGGPGNLPLQRRNSSPPGLGNLPWPSGGISPDGPGNLPTQRRTPPGPGNLPLNVATSGAFAPTQDDLYRSEVLRKIDLGSFNPNSGIAGPTSMASAASPGAFDLEAVRKAWAYGGKGHTQQVTPEELQQFMRDNQNILGGATLRGEKLYDPSGRFVADMIGNFKSGDPSQMSRIFLDGIGSNNKPRGKTPPAGKTPPGLTVVDSGHGNDEFMPDGSRNPNYKKPGGGGPGGTAPPAANNFLTQIRQLIMDRLGKMSGDPSMNDPALAAQSNAYRVSRERGAQQQRAAMAERAAANGTLQGGQSSGSFDTELGGIHEAAGEDIAANDAQLLGNEMIQRRAEVQNLLQLAMNSGDAQSARELQMQLAKMDEAIRLKQLAENRRQYDLSDKYRYRALDETGRQFDDTIGRQYGRDYEDDYRWRVGVGLGG